MTLHLSFSDQPPYKLRYKQQLHFSSAQPGQRLLEQQKLLLLLLLQRRPALTADKSCTRSEPEQRRTAAVPNRAASPASSPGRGVTVALR